MALPGVREVKAKRVLLTLLFACGSQLQLEACMYRYMADEASCPTPSSELYQYQYQQYSICSATASRTGFAARQSTYRTPCVCLGSASRCLCFPSPVLSRPFSYERTREERTRPTRQRSS
ncbi:hypothetical protein GGI42DRAFT_322242 [Trichoderma sp. SZMC 28013]